MRGDGKTGPNLITSLGILGMVVALLGAYWLSIVPFFTILFVGFFVQFIGRTIAYETAYEVGYRDGYGDGKGWTDTKAKEKKQ